MGGKKKSLANRLAKMSDEERARYLQHKADQEEEARRRKEQLISTFLKIKIKKEEQFSRLNLAKINQNWHQILRQRKIKDMKDDVEHMKKAIARVMDYKNRTIQKLLEELEQAETQYSYNFSSHSTHIDQTILSNQDYLENLRSQYLDDLDNVFTIFQDENSTFLEKNLKDFRHLKTVIYSQNYKSQIGLKEDYETLYLKRRSEENAIFALDLEGLTRRLDEESGAIWRQIAVVVGSYVRRNDARRLHLAELKRLDAESAEEIAKNQDRISDQQTEIDTLEENFRNLQENQRNSIRNLEIKLKEEARKLEVHRRALKKSLAEDDGKLRLMTEKSNQTLDNLENLKVKGAQIIGLAQNCKKFETVREKVAQWLPQLKSDSPTDDELLKPPEIPESGVDTVILSVKDEATVPKDGLDLFEKFQNSLGNLENFWIQFNEVGVELRSLKSEKRVISAENKQLRGMIRAVLEAEALDQKSPQLSRISTRAPSKIRGAYSAPTIRNINF